MRVCLTCDCAGFVLVPCRRDDPDKLVPSCRHREHPTPSGGCHRPGCLEAVKVISCPRCDGLSRDLTTTGAA